MSTNKTANTVSHHCDACGSHIDDHCADHPDAMVISAIIMPRPNPDHVFGDCDYCGVKIDSLCAYCNADMCTECPVPYSPGCADWAVEAGLHYKGCEWADTCAHNYSKGSQEYDEWVENRPYLTHKTKIG